MKLALISPVHNHRHILDLEYTRQIFLGASASTCMPMVLTILDALTPPEYEVDVIDEQVEPIDFEKPYDVVAITTLTPLATRAYEVADAFRSRGVWVVLGGLHVTMFPEEAARHADTICIGEAEETWPAFLNDFRAKCPKAVYRAYQSVSLTACVIPRWNRLRERRYRFFSIQASRGCKYNCDYCSVRKVFGTIRYKPIPHVLREIEEVRQHVLPRSDRFLLVDDNLFSDRDYAMAFIRAITPLKLRWECFAPLNIAHDDEMLALLKTSGCERLSVGIESISQSSLAGVNKAGVNKVDEYRTSIERIYDNGLQIVGLFMLGFDGDDESVFDRTAAFVQETRITYPIFSILVPGPGTRLHQRFEQEGRILHRRWEDYDGTRVVFRPKLMSPDTLQEGYYWLFKQLYRLDALFERTIALWERGLLKRPAPERTLRFLASAVLIKELARQPFDRPDLLPFLRRTLAELWRRDRLDIINLSLNLGLAEYVSQLPVPSRDFRIPEPASTGAVPPIDTTGRVFGAHDTNDSAI